MKTANQAWINSIYNVMNCGDRVNPRGTNTREIMNQVIEFDMNYPICYHPERNLSYKFMAAEAYWITSGSSLVEDIAPYCRHIDKYSDDGYIFNGAYGPAFSSQIGYIINCLKKDNSTRQAVMTIWHPNPERSKDQKCTVCLIFNIRGGRLHTTVIMRSNDLFLGRPYDMFNFTIMTLKILTELNSQYAQSVTKLGNMTLHAVSSHIYDENTVQCLRLLDNKNYDSKLSEVPDQALWDWRFVTDSLLTCRDAKEVQGLWSIG